MIRSGIYAINIIFLVMGISLAADQNVPGDYKSIQLAIDSSNPGDTINIHSGIYDEHISITKQLKLIGLVMEEEMPVISSTTSGSVIIVRADGVAIEGLNITGKKSFDTIGILVTSNNATLRDNLVTNCSDYAIKIVNSKNNKINNNTISYNNIGICLINSSSEITYNEIAYNHNAICYDVISNIKSTISNNNIANNIYGMILQNIKEPP